jgi:hypothetical protein
MPLPDSWKALGRGAIPACVHLPEQALAAFLGLLMRLGG